MFDLLSGAGSKVVEKLQRSISIGVKGEAIAEIEYYCRFLIDLAIDVKDRSRDWYDRDWAAVVWIFPIGFSIDVEPRALIILLYEDSILWTKECLKDKLSNLT